MKYIESCLKQKKKKKHYVVLLLTHDNLIIPCIAGTNEHTFFYDTDMINLYILRKKDKFMNIFLISILKHAIYQLRKKIVYGQSVYLNIALGTRVPTS